jgi:hypothetical protein
VSHSFGYIPKSGIGRSMFRFLSSLQIFFQSGCTSYIPTRSVRGFLFPTSSPTPVVSGVANDGYSNG